MRYIIMVCMICTLALGLSADSLPAIDSLTPVMPADPSAPSVWSQILGWLGISGWGGIITLVFGLLAVWLGIDKYKTIKALDTVGELFKDLAKLLDGAGTTSEVAEDVHQIGELVKTIKTSDTETAALKAKVVSAQIAPQIAKGRKL